LQVIVVGTVPIVAVVVAVLCATCNIHMLGVQVITVLYLCPRSKKVGVFYRINAHCLRVYNAYNLISWWNW